ncbi:TrbI/VirB10 family protein [Hellea balneolensis]|uniref:TrbI/VirB10 family protein n=1 Tax=Hellea balneolensis TaxID=287478 RepID=UPI00040479F7|nr:TrbI/VirB10 family protein [Hellea balneolensis]
MFAALAVALQSPDYDEAKSDELYNVTHKPMAAGLELLPKSYGEMKPRLGPPLPGDLGAAYMSADLESVPVEPDAGSKPPQKLASYSAPRTAKPAYQPIPVQPVPQNEGSASLFFELSGRGINRQAAQIASVSGPYIPPPEYPSFNPPPSGFDSSPISSDPNGQGTKQAFIDRETDYIYNSHGLVSPRSPYQVMAGNLIPASLVTGLNSDLPGQVIGQVTENVFDTVTGQHLLIPQGSRLMGRYDSVIAFGQSRALVAWTRLILPNGDSIQLDNLPGSDAQGFAGLKDKVDRHTWQFIKGAALSSLLSIGSELASDDGDRLTRALQNAGQDTANIAGQRIIDRNLNVQPTLKIRQGWRFNVIVSRDLILKPYGG